VTKEDIPKKELVQEKRGSKPVSERAIEGSGGGKKGRAKVEWESPSRCKEESTHLLPRESQDKRGKQIKKRNKWRGGSGGFRTGGGRFGPFSKAKKQGRRGGKIRGGEGRSERKGCAHGSRRREWMNGKGNAESPPV